MWFTFFGTVIKAVSAENKKKNTMKTKVLFITGLLLAAFLINPAITNAKTANASKELDSNIAVDFSKALSKTIKYPVKASENQIEGTIWVSIDVDENGLMSVEQSNHSCCDKLHDEVVKQLDGKKIKNFDDKMVGNHQLKMVFQIEK